MLFTASLLGAQQKIGIVWRTNWQARLLCPWARHLTGRLLLYEADRWPTRTSPGCTCQIANLHTVKDNSWVPTSGSPPCWWWGYQSLMTGSKWAAIFLLAKCDISQTCACHLEAKAGKKFARFFSTASCSE